MTREEVKVDFGLSHDHLMVNKQEVSLQNGITNGSATINTSANNGPSQENQKNTPPSALSTIAILMRHPMYDCLVLKKRYRASSNGYTLEFPTSNNTNNKHSKEQDCCKTKLISVYLDGDDPIYQREEKSGNKNGLLTQDGEIVYVPMNGLLARLENYERHGVSIDSRVYAFAMGLKTAEKFLTTSSMKEIQETPPL